MTRFFSQLPQSAITTAKRPHDEDGHSAAKKTKREAPGLLSNIMKIRTAENGNAKNVSAAVGARLKAQEREANLKERPAAADTKCDGKKESGGKLEFSLTFKFLDHNSLKLYSMFPLLPTAVDATAKRDERRIRWADSSGKALAVAQENDVGSPDKAEVDKVQDPRLGSNRPSWSDRKKKDLLHEKELLLQAR